MEKMNSFYCSNILEAVKVNEENIHNTEETMETLLALTDDGISLTELLRNIELLKEDNDRYINFLSEEEEDEDFEDEDYEDEDFEEDEDYEDEDFEDEDFEDEDFEEDEEDYDEDFDEDFDEDEEDEFDDE